MKRLGRAAVLALALVGAAALLVTAWLFNAGIGTRAAPGALETRISRAARHALVPAAARELLNPEPATPEVRRAGLEHWADHCASCHANDGSGNTPIGQALYPRAPDMRFAETQDLSDGELFYIIEEGVKLTGMPAWSTGTPEGERDSWHLVHFIRHLPSLTQEELTEMESLNPLPPAAWQAQEEERRFLAGEDRPPAQAPHRHQ